eukprot:gb/GFBE01023645.1/.p1 GENE.gb/GFBE01023645.1/~~gb/GFBE01023645.1/.p1  ORF type:complete len:427 (+),score=73.84 gb/GFBE01023645.1/:1-1281(+)
MFGPHHTRASQRVVNAPEEQDEEADDDEKEELELRAEQTQQRSTDAGLPAVVASPKALATAAAAAVAAASETSIASPDEMRAEASACCNEGATLLRKGVPQDALAVLARAQALLERLGNPLPSASEEDQRAVVALRADVAGNMGICHRRLKELGPAVRQLQLALKLHRACMPAMDQSVSLSDLRTLIAAHLNLASCHLDSEAPDAALNHARIATELGGRVLSGFRKANGEVTAEPTDNDFAMLAVAFHKVAEAHQGLKDWGQATFAYAQAHEVVQRSLGPRHPLTQSLERASAQSRRPAGNVQRRHEAVTAFSDSIGKSTGCPTIRPGHGKRVLPSIPPGARGAAALKQKSGFVFELAGYDLAQAGFPSWPPPKANREEQDWYHMARACRYDAPTPPEPRMRQEPVLDDFMVTPSQVRSARGMGRR